MLIFTSHFNSSFILDDGVVGMSLHEKGRNKKMPTPIHKVTHNPIPTSLFLQDHNMQAIGCQDVVLCLVHYKQHVKDVGMGL